MSGTLTVKELIKELLEYDMDEPVFLALGDSYSLPNGSAKISRTRLHDAGIICGFGVYIYTRETLVDPDSEYAKKYLAE